MIARLLNTFGLLLILCCLGCEQTPTKIPSASNDPAVQDQPADAQADPPPGEVKAGKVDAGEANAGKPVVEAESIAVADDLQPDAAVAEIIQPYMEQMHASMDEVIGQAAADITRGRPESALGNLVADALLWHANKISPEQVDISLVNNGGIRLPALMKGPIRVADIYQLVPFDNRVVILTLSGQQIEDLLISMAKKGGEPMSGLTYKIDRDETQVREIRIGQQALVPTATYRLATLDYLASIGREYQILQDAASRVDDTVFLRDAMVTYIRQLNVIEPTLDGRVSYEE
ncbi:MAG: 5'-nucleotidase C-terminal domain-containing protein [bacterium]|nr:5'-nucleotidase C-terminal domain-containing protein [bacterium]